jgi:antitoxin VapB
LPGRIRVPRSSFAGPLCGPKREFCTRYVPKEYQFSTDEVFIRKEGEDVILSPRPRDWQSYLESAPVASEAFMADVEDLPVQEREP